MNDSQTPMAGSPIYQESQVKNAKWLWFLVILIIIGVLVFAFVRGIGPFGQLSLLTRDKPSPTPLAVSSPFPEESPTPTDALDRSAPTVRVLNGSGRVGAASSFKDFLEGKGYAVSAIGNADSYDYQKTTIRFKETFKKFEQILFSDLSDQYSVEVSTSDLEATDSADIEVIVGAK